MGERRELDRMIAELWEHRISMDTFKRDFIIRCCEHINSGKELRISEKAYLKRMHEHYHRGKMAV